MIVLDIETAPIPITAIPAKNKEYLIEKSKNKKSTNTKFIDGDVYGGGAIGKFELNQIICCCVKKDDEDIVAYTECEKELIESVFKQLVTQDHTITFNGNGFDLPMLKLRGILHNLHTTMSFNIKPWSEHYIDVRYQLTDQYGVGDLAYWCRVFDIEPPKWQISDKSDMSKYPIEDVVKGCKEDVRALYELYQKLNNQIKEE